MRKAQLHQVHGRRFATSLPPASRMLGLLCLVSIFVVATSTAAAIVDSSLLPLTEEEKSLCGKKLPVAACKSKMSMCAPLDTLLAPLLGTPQNIVSCVNKTGIPLKADFLADLGKAVMTGMMSLKLSKKPTEDPIANYAIRQCILGNTGMVGDDLKLNRTVITAQVANMSSPNLSAAVGLAVNACPEPLDLKIKSYLKCLKKTCVTSIPDSTPLPFVGSSLAGGANTWGSSFPGIF